MFARTRVGVSKVRSGADGRKVTAVSITFRAGNGKRVAGVIRGVQRVRDIVSIRQAANWNYTSEEGEVTGLGVGRCIMKPMRAGYCFTVGSRAGRLVVVSPNCDPGRLTRHIHRRKYAPITVLLARKRFSRTAKTTSLTGRFSVPICTCRARGRALRGRRVGLYRVAKRRRIFRTSVCLGSRRRLSLTKFRVQMLRAPKRAPKKYYCCFPCRGIMFSKSALFYASMKHASFPNKDVSSVVHSVGRGLVALPSHAAICPKRGSMAAVRGREVCGPCL